jgi:pimeloyl-ACP methyl ester carboxylesterase
MLPDIAIRKDLTVDHQPYPIKVPTLGIRGDVDGCIPEVAWNMVRPKSFPNGLTLEMMPGIGHFPQLEDPQWVSERLVRWVKQYSETD